MMTLNGSSKASIMGSPHAKATKMVWAKHISIADIQLAWSGDKVVSRNCENGIFVSFEMAKF